MGKQSVWERARSSLTKSGNPAVQPAKKTVSSVTFFVDDIEVLLTKKKIKNVNLRVKTAEGPVVVSAPPWVTQGEVEHFVRQKISWIKKRQQALARSPRVPAQKTTPEELEQWRARVIPATEALVRQWEPIIGVQASVLAYRNMTSRWGSCNPKTGRICINLQLANYPAVCLEYVVVHELCHLIEKGHGPYFKTLMSQHLPDWQARRALLR